MIAQSQIAEVLDTQNQFWLHKDAGVPREKLSQIKIHDAFASIITGIRRCGKSTFLRQLLPSVKGNSIFMNFEDPRLAGFQTDDFRRLDAELKSRKIKNLFFDEIQVLDKWELYMRQKLDEGYKVVITGSNATLLSREMGTKLTGRHLSNELFPFSYTEYVTFTKKRDGLKAIESYLQDGGFPEYLKIRNPQVVQQLLDDIVQRDIAVRYAVRDVASLRKLAVYLISNIGKPISATKLKSTLNIKATSTILEYLSYMEDAYLVQYVPKFSYKQQVQIRNPKKVYAIDLGMFTHNSITFSEERGRRLENMVYLHYRRSGMEITYFSEKKECDFIIFQKGTVREAVQVCYELNEDNLEREMDGLVDAMEFLHLKKGIIITLQQTDVYNINGKKIEVMALRELLTRG